MTQLGSTIKISLQSFDHRAMHQAARSIIDAVRLTGASFRGPIPMPVRTRKLVVNRSPHVDKKSREQFEFRTHKLLVYIDYTTTQTVAMLKDLPLPYGVKVEVELG